MQLSAGFVSAFAVLLPLLVDGSSKYCTEKRGRTLYRKGIDYVACGWRRCCRYRAVAYTQYYTVRICCPGWGGTYCNIAMCNPPCGTRGFCVRPNVCYCGSLGTAKVCPTESCSFSSSDCYPGTCNKRDQSTVCSCHQSYGGSNCLQLRQGPNITSCTATLKKVEGAVIKKMQTMNCLTKGTNVPGKPGDTTYMRPQDLSMIEMHMLAKHTLDENLPQKPPYIKNTRRGVVQMTARATLAGTVSQNTPISCKALTPVIGAKQPYFNAPCDFVYSLTSTTNSKLNDNDRLVLTVSMLNGGYKGVHDSQTDRVVDVFFKGMQTTKKFTVIFDSTPPSHCSTFNNCTDYQPFLDTGMDIKRKGLDIGFYGWDDTVSGIKRFDYEIFRLVPNLATKKLQEEVRSVTQGSLTPAQLNTIPKTYTPSVAGMYSVILTVVDNADNKAQARTLCLYDPRSTITVDPPTRKTFIVETASVESEYEWITRLNEPINVTWKNHFKNLIHEQGKLLYAVESFTKGLDDNEGNRTTREIKNIRGITQFVFAHGHDHAGGTLAVRSQGITLKAPLVDRYSLTSSRIDGDSIRLWVTAKDIIGNEVTDSILVHFDSTKPWVGVSRIERNVSTTKVPYGTKITVQAKDESSGIHGINITVLRQVGTRRERLTSEYQRISPLKNTTKNMCLQFPNLKCLCTPMGNCYSTEPSAYVNHCWFRHLTTQLDSSTFEAILDVNNGARLVSTVTVQLNIMNRLSGLDVYPPFEKKHFITTAISTNTATLSWTYPAACYDIKGVSVKYTKADGSEVERDIIQTPPPVSVELYGLRPGQSNSVQFTVVYEDLTGRNRHSAILSYNFFTASPQSLTGMSSGAAAGLSIGVLLILLIPLGLILIVIVRKRQGKTPIPKVVRRIPCSCFTGSGFAAKRAGPLSKGYTNNEYVHPNGMQQSFYDDDDVYIYGQMDFAESSTWHVSPSRVTYLGDLTKGRFAVIMMASLKDKNADSSVVAKMLKGGASEQDQLLMKAKLNFYATALPRCEYVVNFVGGDVEGPNAPVILLEFCEGGNLREWATEQDKAKEDTVEQMIQFAIHIAKGLKHLHANKVLHRRLAARNVLLKHEAGEWIAKLHGFGPMKGEAEDENQSTKERIPLKWMAPETIDVPEGQKRTYSTKTDAWSYGITIWEMFSLGEAPFADVRGGQLADELKQGYRLPAPELCPGEIYNDIMMRCWSQKPKSRPECAVIVTSFEKLYQNSPGDAYYYG